MSQITNLQIPPLLPTEISAAESPAKALPVGDQTSFKEFMLEAIDHVNSMQQDADQAVEALMTGGDVNAAEVLTSLQKADLTFKMMLQVRNKLVQAYQEIRDIRI